MFRVEYTNYSGAYSFRAIDGVLSMKSFILDGRVVLEGETVSQPFRISYYPSDDVVIDIIAHQPD